MDTVHRRAPFVQHEHGSWGRRQVTVPSILPSSTPAGNTGASVASASSPDAVATVPSRASAAATASSVLVSSVVVPSSTASSAGLIPALVSAVAPAASSATTSRVATTSATVRTTSATDTTSAAATTNPGTTTLIVTGSARLTTSSSSSSSSSLASSSNSSTSDGPSVGTIVGIVAGVLVGVIVLATICGWLFRKKFGRKDEDEDSPFDRDDFRRQSMLIDDDQGGYAGGHSPQMSEHSMNPAYGNLGRQNTVLPGLARNGTMQDPRPPSSIVNHFQRPQQQQQMAPSFSPGQIVPNAYGQPSPPRPVFNAAPGGSYGGGNPGMDLYGGYPLAAGQHQQLDRGIYGMPAQHLQHPNYAQQNQQQGLERNPSNASGYSQGPPANDRRSPAPSHSPHDDRPLSLVHEEDGETYSRSGTPVDSNVQQSYFAHGHSDSTSSARGGPLAPNHRLSVGTNLPGYEPFGKGGFGSSSLSPEVIENPFARQRSLTGETWQDAKDNRAQRTLSVRNGNEQHMHNGRPVSTAESDAYGGYS